MLLNVDILEIVKPDRVCSPTLVADDLYRLVLHLFTFLIKYSQSGKLMIVSPIFKVLVKLFILVS